MVVSPLIIIEPFHALRNILICIQIATYVVLLEHWPTSTRHSKSHWSCWEWASFKEWFNRGPIERNSSMSIYDVFYFK